MFGLSAERVDLVAELIFDGPDEVAPALPGSFAVGSEILDQVGVFAVVGGG